MKLLGIGAFLSVVALCTFISGGCDDVERHRLLTRFFDGVPPLGGEVEVVASDPNAIYQRRVRPEVVWYIHEPQKDCARCHGNREQRSFSREVQMANTVPELCYECHEGMKDLEGRVHGPVAVSECLMCHDPHKSQNEHLLKKAVPEICFQCHNPQAIAQIENHEQEHYAKCLDCHTGHTSDRKYLLKKDQVVKAMEANGSSVEVGDPNSLAKPPTQ